MIDILPDQLETVKQILAQYVPESEIRAFGSRIDGSAKPYSDLDLAVVAEEKLSIRTQGELKEAFQESDLPFRVDVLDWHSISESFQQVISKKYETISLS